MILFKHGNLLATAHFIVKMCVNHVFQLKIKKLRCKKIHLTFFLNTIKNAKRSLTFIFTIETLNKNVFQCLDFDIIYSNERASGYVRERFCYCSIFSEVTSCNSYGDFCELYRWKFDCLHLKNRAFKKSLTHIPDGYTDA